MFLREAKRTRLDTGGGGGFVTDNEWVLDTEGECSCEALWEGGVGFCPGWVGPGAGKVACWSPGPARAPALLLVSS